MRSRFSRGTDVLARERPAGRAAAGWGPSVRLAVLALIAVGATVAAHWPVLSAQALSIDDDQYLTENRLVQHPSWSSAGRFLGEVLRPTTVDGYYQPLTMISLMLDYAVAGSAADLRPFHRTSLVLHAANTLLVVLLLHGLFGEPWVAALAGLLFGVHPMTVEAVAWVGERKTLLAAFFALSCLVVYVRHARRPGGRTYGACLALYLLALVSKPTSTPLPVVMLVLDYWPLGRLNRRAVVEKLPFLAIGVVFGAITVVSQARTAGIELPGGESMGRPVLILCHNIVFYLYKIVWPVRLSSFYGFPEPLSLSEPAVLAGVAGTCVLVAGLAVSLRWTRALAAGWLMFFAMILPTLGVVGFTIAIAFDKYAYLPSVGLLAVLAWGLARLWFAGSGSGRARRRAGMVCAAAVAAVLLGVGTRRGLSHWQTTETLCDDTIRVAPTAYPFYHHRGNLRLKGEDYDRAIEDYGRALALRPRDAEVYNNRGAAFLRKGDVDQSIRDHTQAIVLRPTYAAAYANRAVALMTRGDHDGAIADCTRAIELDPQYAAAYSNRGTAYGSRSEYARALADLDRAIALNPDDASYYKNRGNARLGLGDYAGAIRDYSRAVERRPTDPHVYGARAMAYFHVQEYEKARADVVRCGRLGGAPDAELVRALGGGAGESRKQ